MIDVIGQHAFLAPKVRGTLRAQHEDFVVEELLGFDLAGDGEHLFCFIEKKGLNTRDVIDHLAHVWSLSPKLISYAGLKDRHAVTRQWFSVHLPGKVSPDLSLVETDNIKLLKTERHHKKLKIGALQANAFRLCIRQVAGASSELEKRVRCILKEGVPNYFGEQRFGYHQENIAKARAVLFDKRKIRNRYLKGLYLSAARSYLFNHLLSQRVEKGLWNQCLRGDIAQLSGSNSIFQVDEPDSSIKQRLAEGDIAPAGPLWGEGKLRARNEAGLFEQNALSSLKDWQVALEAIGAKLAYRPFVVRPKNMVLDRPKNDLVTVSFVLPPGSYATAVMRELIQT